MITNNEIKAIKGLRLKKNRIEEQRFFAEGEKVVLELLNSDLVCENIFCLEDFSKNIPSRHQSKIKIISNKQLEQISALKSPNLVLSVFKIPQFKTSDNTGITLVLDDVKDPGNLGTIIRLADWFDVKEIVCSMETVDVFNPKVIQATMGSLARIPVIYTDLENYLSKEKRVILGTFLGGENIYKIDFPNDLVLVMGSESHGISEKIEKLVNSKITIPQFGKTSTESLNVSVATAICLSQIKQNSTD